MNLTEYIPDDDLLDFYLNNFDSDELEDFVSFLNKSGNPKKHIIEMFTDYQDFYRCFELFLNVME